MAGPRVVEARGVGRLNGRRSSPTASPIDEAAPSDWFKGTENPPLQEHYKGVCFSAQKGGQDLQSLVSGILWIQFGNLFFTSGTAAGAIAGQDIFLRRELV
uniref:Uncharacterized protein n=1 Tax=Oryza glaberrima TaxID=4538 RepID=I1R5F2_ORYGL